MATNSKSPANKTSSKRASSSKRKAPRVAKTSRKTVRKTTAAYARKAGDSGGGDGGGDDKSDKAKADTTKDAKDVKADTTQDAKDAKDIKAGKADATHDAKADAAHDAKADATHDAKAAKDDAPQTKASAQPVPASADENVGDDAAAAVAPPSGADDDDANPLLPLPDFDPSAEYATLLPPTAIDPRWDPTTKAPPPAKAPPGDSRSFRRHRDGKDEFVFIYRRGSFLIRREGVVGTLGTWTITEYPHQGSAAHAYAQEGSELSSTGYRDLR